MGGERGRLIPEDDRKSATELIDEAYRDGARLFKACKVLEISVSTFRRWKTGNYKDQRKGAKKDVPRKLSEEERQEIIDVCCSEEYKDDNPYEIHSSLLDKGKYIASISSFYRVLRDEKLVNHRSNTRAPHKRVKPPELTTDGPNQVWTWDITWLKSNIRGLFFYAYTIIDIWDRSIVKWSIHDCESDEYATQLFHEAVVENDYPDVFVHSDNGNPMKGVTLLQFFNDFGINNSYSRPRVSDDNPFIESWFKTMKYDISYPGKFNSISFARQWYGQFVHIYNTEHKHSGLHYMTPKQVREGKYSKIANSRNKVMKKAFKRNPSRWGRKVKLIPETHIVCLNPSMDTRINSKLKKVV